MTAYQNFVKIIVWVLIRMMYRIRCTGIDNIPMRGPAILTPNHVSFLDAILIAIHSKRPIHYAMYWKLYNKTKWLVAPLGAFPIASRTENIAVFREAFAHMSKCLDNGELVCIFPEGKLSHDGSMNKFKGGVKIMLHKNPVPVIPIGLGNVWGSYFSRKQKGWLKFPSHFMQKVYIRVGTPLDPSSSLQEIEDSVRALV